jgi:hypothetical protein
LDSGGDGGDLLVFGGMIDSGMDGLTYGSAGESSEFYVLPCTQISHGGGFSVDDFVLTLTNVDVIGISSAASLGLGVDLSIGTLRNAQFPLRLLL